MRPDYWQRRYQAGGTSGPGSRGPEAAHKAALVQSAVERLGIVSLLDVGCGDGLVASLMGLRRGYVGYDPSPTALQTCRTRMPGAVFTDRRPTGTYDAVLCMDVLFHLPDDGEYRAFLAGLFAQAQRFVLIYGTDHELTGAAHVRHRHWTPDIPEGWTIRETRPSRFKTFWVLAR